jgi:hypothetical protein
MLTRRTALIRTHERRDWGGTYADSSTWASMFRNLQPYDFGVMGAQTFASELGSYIVNKPLLWMTQAQGNVCELPGGQSDYRWQLLTDTHTRAVITKVDPNLGTQPGKMGQPFNIYLDRNWYGEPVVLKTESINMPMLKIIGFPVQESDNSWRYTVVVQDGDPASYVDPDVLQIGKTVVDATTQVSDELNMKYGGIEFGSMYDLQGHIGSVARKIEVTDKFIRLEIEAAKRGQKPNASYTFNGSVQSSAISSGYIVVKKGTDGKLPPKSDIVKAGGFITVAEAMLEERIAMDKEFQMVFGRTQVSADTDTGRVLKSSAGWLQMAKDGNYREHNGNITLGEFTDFLDAKFFNTVDFKDRAIEIHTGSEGMKFASRLIAAEAGFSPFVFDSNYFIEKVPSQVTDKALRWGAQFTELRSYNGIILRFVYDPTKDNPYFYPELHPETGKPVESGSFDIFDLGETSAAPQMARTKSNVCMIWEPAQEEYFMVSNIYNLYNGSVKDGSNVYHLNKEAGIYRASTVGFQVWDVSRSARFQMVV